MSRGIRNCNPGNIKDFGISWNGIQDWEDRTLEQQDEKTFVVFRASWWGIRALAKLLGNYQRKHGLDTVEAIVGRYAPPSDNNPTTAYSTYIADAMGVPGDRYVDLSRYEVLEDMVRAIIRFENGSCPYTWELKTGLIMAGVEPVENRI